MANSVWQGTVQDASGNIVTGAEISVYDEGTGTLATIYSDIGGTALTNPFFSDSNGFAQFYAAAGQYRITAVEAGSGLNQTFRHVRLGEAGSVDTGTASDEVPLNSDLTDVLRDSDIGQTVAGLSSPGETSWDSGNLNRDSFGGDSGSRVSGEAVTTSAILFKIKDSNTTEPSSITVTGNFDILNADLTIREAALIPSLSVSSGVGNVTVGVSVSVANLVIGATYWLSCNSSGSNIEIS
jgi:hypothetical protein